MILDWQKIIASKQWKNLHSIRELLNQPENSLLRDNFIYEAKSQGISENAVHLILSSDPLFGIGNQWVSFCKKIEREEKINLTDVLCKILPKELSELNLLKNNIMLLSQQYPHTEIQFYLNILNESIAKQEIYLKKYNKSLNTLKNRFQYLVENEHAWNNELLGKSKKEREKIQETQQLYKNYLAKHPLPPLEQPTFDSSPEQLFKLFKIRAMQELKNCEEKGISTDPIIDVLFKIEGLELELKAYDLIDNESIYSRIALEFKHDLSHTYALKNIKKQIDYFAYLATLTDNWKKQQQNEIIKILQLNPIIDLDKYRDSAYRFDFQKIFFDSKSDNHPLSLFYNNNPVFCEKMRKLGCVTYFLEKVLYQPDRTLTDRIYRYFEKFNSSSIKYTLNQFNDPYYKQIKLLLINASVIFDLKSTASSQSLHNFSIYFNHPKKQSHSEKNCDEKLKNCYS